MHKKDISNRFSLIFSENPENFILSFWIEHFLHILAECQKGQAAARLRGCLTPVISDSKPDRKSVIYN